MTWTPMDEEIKTVPLLDGLKRYGYCIKKVADQQQLWSLRQEDGWALAGDDAGREVVPIWPHEKFASLCAAGMWAGHQPAVIDIVVWLERWTPGLERDGRLVAIFPTPQDQGVAVEPRRLEADLREVLSQYE